MSAFRDAYLAGFRAAIHESDNRLRLLMSDPPKHTREDRILGVARRVVTELANDPTIPEEL